MADLAVMAWLVGLAAAYHVGSRGRPPQPAQARNFYAAEAVLAVALLPPLGAAAHDSLTAHMVQHVLLLVVAAPLLALGAPLPTLLWALPERARRRALALWGASLRNYRRRWGSWVTATLLAQTVVMLSWHAPSLYDATTRNVAVHVLEHATYLLSATAFAWAVGVGSAQRHGAAVPVLFVAALPGTALGAALTLTGTPWYAEYPSMSDQQLAGVVMWGFAGLAYVLAAACLFGLWLAGLDRESPARPLVTVEGGAR